MKPVAVFYATREGQTQRIAGHVAERLLSSGIETDLRNLLAGADPGDLCRYSGIILAASVHGGRHEREMVRFVKMHREQLEAMPASFLSVTLSQAGAQRKDEPAEKHRQFTVDVEKMIEHFCHETGWHPRRVLPVAGALTYTRYNFFLRFIMKRIAARAGAGTDSSRDYEYTDWATLDRFVDEAASEIVSSSEHPGAIPAAS